MTKAEFLTAAVRYEELAALNNLEIFTITR